MVDRFTPRQQGVHDPCVIVQKGGGNVHLVNVFRVRYEHFPCCALAAGRRGVHSAAAAGLLLFFLCFMHRGGTIANFFGVNLRRFDQLLRPVAATRREIRALGANSSPGAAKQSK